MVLDRVPAEVELGGGGGVAEEVDLASLEDFRGAELFEEVAGEFVTEGVAQEGG